MLPFFICSFFVKSHLLSPEKFSLDEFAQYFRRGNQATEGSLYENSDIDSLSALSYLCRSSR